MKKFVLSAATLVVVALAGSAAAAESACDAVVADTVAEMRAGAGDTWNDSMERLARAAAGSACVKSQSGRYAPITTSMPQKAPQSVGEEALSSEVASTAPAETQAEANEAASNETEEGVKIGGLTFRSLSGSPSKKPYERSRSSKQSDNSDDES